MSSCNYCNDVFFQEYKNSKYGFVIQKRSSYKNTEYLVYRLNDNFVPLFEYYVDNFQDVKDILHKIYGYAEGGI